MSRLLRSAAAAALTVAAACAVAGSANAQTYNRLVVFGDSLSDNGNVQIITGGATPPAPFYWQGRFSTGPVFTELLGFDAQRFGFNAFGLPNPPVNLTGSVNLAYGGAVTGLETRPGAPPGLTDQLNAYLARGGRFGAGDLVTVLGGANNIFQALPTAGASANPVGAITPIVTASAAEVNQLVDRVAQAGAGTILVANLPRLGITAQFLGTPAQPLADYAGTTFNTALQTGLAATAAARAGTNIISMDLAKAHEAMIANPGAFGFTNVTTACFNQTALTLCSTPDTYFYLDGVHPTRTGHALVAALSNDYLYYGDRGAQTALQGETAFRHREDALEAATAALSDRRGFEAGTRMTMSALVDQTDTDARGAVGASETTGHGARVALETSSDTLSLGLAANWRDARIEGGGQSFDLTSVGIDLYGGFRSGDVFVNAAAGLSSDDYNGIERVTGVGPMIQTGATRGSSKGARLQAGLWWDLGGLAVSPRAAVTWASSAVDGYAEQGFAAAYSYDDRRVELTTAEITVRAEGQSGAWGFFAEGGYRDSLDDSSQAVRVGIANNTARVLSRAIDEPFGGQFLASAGISGDLGPFTVEVGYRGRFGDHADSHVGGVTLKLPL